MRVKGAMLSGISDAEEDNDKFQDCTEMSSFSECVMCRPPGFLCPEIQAASAPDDWARAPRSLRPCGSFHLHHPKHKKQFVAITVCIFPTAEERGLQNQTYYFVICPTAEERDLQIQHELWCDRLYSYVRAIALLIACTWRRDFMDRGSEKLKADEGSDTM